ncbi:MAG: radical SAM protein, partial [bacterium]
MSTSDIPNRPTVSTEKLMHWPLEKLREIHLELGQQCNVRCSMCYQTDFSPATKLPDIVWKERLRLAYPMAERLTLQGGEPTILSNCRELLEMMLREYPHMKLLTVTNGILFNGLWEEAFLQQGAFLNFSLDAIHPDLYRKIVQFGRQDKVVENIDRVVAKKRRLGSPLTIRISSVVLKETVEELPVFVQWAVDHGLDQVLFEVDPILSLRHSDTVFVQQRIAEAYGVADRNPQIKLIGLDDFDWLYSMKYKLTPIRTRQAFTVEKKPCPVAFNTLFVDYRGIARPCCKSWFPFGNLVEETLQEVWNSKNAFLFRRRMLNDDFRDCMVACHLNTRPIDARTATVRKAYWLFRRDPKAAA